MTLLHLPPSIEPLLQPWQDLLAERRSSILVENLWDAPKALLIARAQQLLKGHLLVITGGSSEEMGLYHDIGAFTATPVLEFPAWETLPNEESPPSSDLVGERYNVLRSLQERPHIILATLPAVLQKLLPLKQFQDLSLKISLKDSLPYNRLIAKLQEMGYTRAPTASDKGQYALRGGIVDIFPVNQPDAYRLEFFGDEIESIRLYDPIGQKSIRPATECQISPARELELIAGKEELSLIFDYLDDTSLIILDNLVQLEDKYASLKNMLDRPVKSFGSLEELFDRLKQRPVVYFAEKPAEDLGEVRLEAGPKQNIYSERNPVHGLTFQMFGRDLTAKRWHHPFHPVSLGGFEEGSILQILYAHPKDKEGLLQEFKDNLVELPSETIWTEGYLSAGFSIGLYTLFSHTELNRRFRLQRPKLRSNTHTSYIEGYDLTPGEHVVHYGNGIGKFLGLQRRKNHLNIDSEFFLIEYADNAQLFVPIDQAHLLSKYVGSNDVEPVKHQLGGKRWLKQREQAESSISGYAEQLLENYAKRAVKGGVSCREDTSEMRAFEDTFPYTETEDQLHAISAVKQDMQSTRAMDRLVCGDVGYGKTEVAMRAAFKAIADGKKQVAVLVPTTILAMQHYENFSARMKHFPVNVALLSRARTAKESKAVLKGLEDGGVDIVIGTHRLISKDIVFKDLGLVIIDEEQRFGVRAKEHLKVIKEGVDYLTLSATPIPRTLYMSLMGARDLSTISTPPQDRLPIQTIITEPNDIVIRNAILRELARDGQVYFIHNRIETIYDQLARLKKLVPHARILVGHGQMAPSELAALFHAFQAGQADILIATTIIENGIDIPNANTIIVDKADHFGLAELYQLRGRVGRWRRQAYAYLLVQKNRGRNEIVAKRLGALAETSGYGGGMKLAMRDLEIRGAGNILGTEQSGQVATIGFHLYCKLLKRQMERLQGKLPIGYVEAKVEFPIDARLPENYVNEQSLRMEFYQRFGEASSIQAAEGLWNELRDRFGPPPVPALWLYVLTRIRIHASNMSFLSLKWEKGTLHVRKLKHKGAFERSIPLIPPKQPEALEAAVLKILQGIV